MKGPVIQNIHVDNWTPYSERAALGWDTPDARYHLWFNHDVAEPFNLDPDDTILYKNPPLGVKRDQPEHFETRRLLLSGKNNLAMFEQARTYAFANDLLAKAKQAHADNEARVKAEQEKTNRIAIIEAAGVDLYEALKSAMLIIEGVNSRCTNDTVLVIKCREAIAKAEGRSKVSEAA